MANGEGNSSLKNWRVAAPISALGLLGLLMLQVQKDAAIALDVAKQHGQELLLIRSEMQVLQGDVKDRTKLRYMSTDASRDHRYIQKDINSCMEVITEHKKNDH